MRMATGINRAVRTHAEVARQMHERWGLKITAKAVQNMEQKAMRKMRYALTQLEAGRPLPAFSPGRPLPEARLAQEERQILELMGHDGAALYIIERACTAYVLLPGPRKTLVSFGVARKLSAGPLLEPATTHSFRLKAKGAT